MINLRYLLVLFLLFSSVNSVYAKKYTVHGQVLAQSASGQYIPQYWKDDNGNAIKPDFKVRIQDHKVPSEITKNGFFKFSLDEKEFPPGKEVTFTVNKLDSEIIYPIDGKTFLPAGGRVKLVLGFKNKKPVSIFAVQLLNTNNETRAIALRNNLAKDLIISKSKERKKVPIYIEKYMAANMPDNGFDYKVKAGDFPNKKLAVDFQNYLERRYKKIPGMFITQKGLK